MFLARAVRLGKYLEQYYDNSDYKYYQMTILLVFLFRNIGIAVFTSKAVFARLRRLNVITSWRAKRTLGGLKTSYFRACPYVVYNTCRTFITRRVHKRLY